MMLSYNETMKSLIIGGQTGPVCVKAHLEALAQHSRIKNGDVQVHVDLGAMYDGAQTMQSILQSIRQYFNVNIKLINSAQE